jgi:hypothetical protein
MAPASAMLQGLNVIQQSPQPSFVDQNDLANEPLSQDLAAHLELWSSVNFASDEPLPSIHDRDSVDCLDNTYDSSKSPSSRQQQPSSTRIDPTLPSPSSTPVFLNYDSYLPGFPASATDAFSVPTAFGDMFFPPGSGGHDTNDSSSIVDPSLSLGHFTNAGPTLSSLNTLFKHDHQQHQNRVTALVRPRSSAGSDLPAPAAKKPRIVTGGAAASSRAKSAFTSPSQTNTSFGGDDANDSSDEHDSPTPSATSKTTGTAAAGGKKDISTPISATEDKRRRNTAASARFRLKKKEREQAMEKRAKELEGRVGELERECEALRRENGWLKGLVVGVTGVSPAEAAGLPGFVSPPQLSSSSGPVSTTAGVKRD